MKFFEWLFEPINECLIKKQSDNCEDEYKYIFRNDEFSPTLKSALYKCEKNGFFNERKNYNCFHMRNANMHTIKS